MTFFVLLVLAVQGVVFYITPQIARPGIFFAVTVDPQVRSMREGGQLLRRYRLLIVAASAVAAIAVLMGGLAMFAGMLIQTAGGVGAWIDANRRARRFGVHREPVRTAALAPRGVEVPGGWLFFVGPLLVLVAVAFYLATNWEAIPTQVPVHWRIDGQADRWEPRSFGSVYRPLLTAFIICGWMLGLAWYTIHRTRQISPGGPAGDREIHFKRFTALILILAAYMTSLVSAGISIRRLPSPDGGALPVWMFMLPPLLILGAVLFYAVRFGQGGARRVPAGLVPGDRSPDDRWKLGLFYYNPDDPAFLVEKRMGFGWTFNFGNKWTWLALALLFSLPLLVWSGALS